MSEPAKPVGPYTPIVRAGEWLVVSGQVGVADGQIVTGGTAAELRQAITNLEAQLATQDAALGDVVKTTVFLRHMSERPEGRESERGPSGPLRSSKSGEQ